MLDIGNTSDWLALQMSFAPCVIGYAEIAQVLNKDPSTMRDGNKYWQWIETYLQPDFLVAVQTLRGQSSSESEA